MAQLSADEAQLATALTRLGLEDRRLLELSYRSKLSHIEISRTEGLPVHVITHRIRGAMSKLGRLLDEDQQRDVG